MLQISHMENSARYRETLFSPSLLLEIAIRWALSSRYWSYLLWSHCLAFKLKSGSLMWCKLEPCLSIPGPFPFPQSIGGYSQRYPLWYIVQIWMLQNVASPCGALWDDDTPWLFFNIFILSASHRPGNRGTTTLLTLACKWGCLLGCPRETR